MRNAVDVKPRRFRARPRRNGATTVEFAIVGPMALLLLIGFAVLALQVYRYQQVAYLARAGARYASTHGAQHRADHRLPVGTATVWEQDIRDNGVLPRCSALAPDKLTVKATWSADNNQANAADSATNFTSTIDNAVTVTVTYQVSAEAYLSTPITLTSSATMPMAY